MDELVITATWDPKAKVWVAESEQIGIATEAPSLDALAAKLPAMIQDLREGALVPFDLIIRMCRPISFTEQTPSDGTRLRR
jgi:hypothetical protein